MKNLRKVSVMQLYMLWKNLSIALLVVTFMIAMSKLLPFYVSPIISLVCAAYLYTLVYNRHKTGNPCILIIYTFFICLIVYTFSIIIINLIYLWKIFQIPEEFIFFTDPFIPSLLVDPVCFITILIIYLRRNKLYICLDCKMKNGDSFDRGKTGILLSSESHFLLKNLIILFGILSVIIWTYYTVFYININTNERDWYIFTWLTVIAFIFVELYFMARYYNIYLDLKENDEVIDQSTLADIEETTYVRFYVICDNYIYVDEHSIDIRSEFREVIDSPFQNKRSVSGMTLAEMKRTIAQMTGIDNGVIRFFFGRKSPDLKNTRLLRFFYFVEKIDDRLPELKTHGKWMDFEEIKKIYSFSPRNMSSVMVSDITRLATIILTSKTFDERGFRKNKLKSYKPSFNLIDLRNSDLDFQDDKWIKISMFNSDTKMFRFKRLFLNRYRNQWR